MKHLRLAPPAIAHTATRLFFGAFALFILSQFLISKDNIWDMIFYTTVIPTLLWLLNQQRQLPCTLLAQAEIRLLLLLFLWLCLSMAWQPQLDEKLAIRFLRHTLTTTLFILSATMFFYHCPRPSITWFWHAAMVVAGIAASLSVALFFGSGPHPGQRLEAIGQLEQSILGASVYGLIGIIALFHLARTNTWRARGGYGALYAIIALLICLTYSRGPLLAFTLTSIGLLVALKAWRLSLVMAAVLSLLLIAMRSIPQWHAAIEAYQHGIVSRGISYRTDIWLHTLSQIAERPLLGWGAATPFTLPLDGLTIAHMHNLLLGTLYYGGLVAGGLLSLLILRLIWRLWTHCQGQTRILLLALLGYSLLSVATDNAKLIMSPSPFWSLFWLPLCYGFATALRNKREADSQGDPA